MLILILLDGGGEKNVIMAKGVDSIESSTAPSESTTYLISTTLIEGHELQGTGLYQRKVKFTSRTLVCIFSSRIKYQLDSVNYSRCTGCSIHSESITRPAVFITLHRAFLSPNSIVRRRVPRRAFTILPSFVHRLYFFFLTSLHPCKSYSKQYAN